MRRIVALALFIGISLGVPAQEVSDTHAKTDVVHYDARVDIDKKLKSISVHEQITLKSGEGELTAFSFPIHAMKITSVKEKGMPVVFDVNQRMLTVTPAMPLLPEEKRTFTVAYTCKPEKGLFFGKDALYTGFHTSHWLICSESSGDRATLALELVVPEGFDVVAGGKFLSKEKASHGKEKHLWRLDTPHSPYLYGFAAGNFTKVWRRDAGVILNYLGTDTDPQKLARIFADTAGMIAFYEKKGYV
jgi:aminopeptidase N